VLKATLVRLGLYPIALRMYRNQLLLSAKIRCLRPYWSYLLRHPFSHLIYLVPFLLFDKEITNFTYEISNVDELISFLSIEMNIDESIVRRYAQELEADQDLRNSLETRLRLREDRNPRALYGRRIGWYCVVRVRKPQLVVETGTRDGLGASVLARGLFQNAQEGHPGELLTFDIDSGAGWLLNSALAGNFQVIIGNTRTVLPDSLSGLRVDLFIHDSDHHYEHETFEMETIFPLLGDSAIILSDNAHASNAMVDFCRKHGLRFAFWKERTKKHFYPGGGIGMSKKL